MRRFNYYFLRITVPMFGPLNALRADRTYGFEHLEI